MVDIKYYIRRYSLMKLERKIEREHTLAIQRFLSLAIIKQLLEHYLRQSEIESELVKIANKRKRLTNSQLWGANFYAIFYYWPDVKYKEELTKRSEAIKTIQKQIGMTLTKEHLICLKTSAAAHKGRRLLLSNIERKRIISLDGGSEATDRRLITASIIVGSIGAGLHGTESAAQSLMVFDALRRVNSNFENATDGDIWFDMMLLNLMEPESYQGMVSLAKGAYFEQLVANDTGGVLHDSFNTPTTDITINGELVQIKATDTVDTINSIDPSISIIATSEVSERTTAMDSGYTNLETTRYTENALGGDPFDTSGSLVEGASFFAGSMGVFAIIRGLASAGQYMENNKKKLKDYNPDNLEEQLNLLGRGAIVGVETVFITTVNSIPTIWNILITLCKWGFNLLYFILFPFIKVLR